MHIKLPDSTTDCLLFTWTETNISGIVIPDTPSTLLAKFHFKNQTHWERKSIYSTTELISIWVSNSKIWVSNSRIWVLNSGICVSNSACRIYRFTFPMTHFSKEMLLDCWVLVEIIRPIITIQLWNNYHLIKILFFAKK